MEAIVIARVSTEEQKEAGLSLPAQLARLEKYCQQRDFAIIKTCAIDESAYKDDREKFDQIIDFVIEQKKKVAVCCDKVDRLSRNMFDKRVAVLYEKALNDELELHFVSDGQILNSKASAANKFHFAMSLGLSKYFSDAISDNVKRANEQKLRKGEWTSKAPLGYKNITLPDGKKGVVIDEHMRHIVKEAFALYGTGAYSMGLLCKKLKEEHGVTWSKSFLDKILANSFYYGIMVVKGKTYAHCYPPIIDKELFDQVQQVKTGFNKRLPFKYAGLPYIYRGLLRCDHCGLAITPEKHKGHVYYHCTQYNGKHDAKWLREEEITRQLGIIFKRLQLPHVVIEEIKVNLDIVHQSKTQFYRQQFDVLTRKQKENAKMMDNLYLDKLRGNITDEHYNRVYQHLHAEKEDMVTRLAQLNNAEDNYYAAAKRLLDLTSDAHTLFEGSEVEERRQLIKLILSNLRVGDEKVLCDVQKPFDVILNHTDSQVWRP